MNAPFQVLFRLASEHGNYSFDKIIQFTIPNVNNNSNMTSSDSLMTAHSLFEMLCT